jgi:hypothetical protein
MAKKKSGRVHIEGSKGRASVDLNRSGTVRAFGEVGGRPRSRQEPKGEVHGGGGLQFRFGGGGKKKTRR